MSNAVERLAAVKSFHFRLDHENGSTDIPLNLKLISAEGDVGVPDRLSAEVQGKAANTSVRVKVIGIGDKSWVTNPFTRQWQSLPGDLSVSDLANPTELVSTVTKSMQDLRLAGRENVDSVSTYRVDGTVDAGALRGVIASAQTGMTVDVRVWVGASDFLPRRIRLSGRASPDEPENIVRTLDLTKYNAQVDIRPPE